MTRNARPPRRGDLPLSPKDGAARARRRAACGCLVALTLSAAAIAQEAAQPAPIVGTQWQFEGRPFGLPCTDWKIAAVAENGDVRAQCRNYVLESSGANDLNPVRVSSLHGVRFAEYTPYAPLLDFPLSVGKRWQGRYRAYTAATNFTFDIASECAVAAWEPVTVAAGTFDAFRIECTDEVAAGPDQGVMHWSRWYAPATGVIVKSRNREDSRRWDFELAAWQGSGGPAAPSSDPVGATAAPTAPAAVEAPPAASFEELAPILDIDAY